MKKLFDSLKIGWNLVSEFKEIVSTFVFVIGGIVFVFNIISSYKLSSFNFWLLIIALLALIFLSLRFLKKYFSKSLSQFINSEEENKINKDVKIFQEKSLQGGVKLYLPKTKQLERLHNLSIRKSQEWSEDAEEEDIVLTIDVNEHGASYRGQTYFYSNWKSQELVVFSPRVSIIKREMEKPLRGIHKPFFKRYPNWNKAVEKAFSQVEDKLQPKFTLWLYSHYDNFHFEFASVENELAKRFEFDFDGKMLKSKNKEIIVP